MSPDQIDLVVTTWRAALSEPQLSATIAASLPGHPSERSERAAWIVDTVTVLSKTLNHPGQFSEVSEMVLARRAGVTIGELTADREALLAAIRLRHPPDPETCDRIERAWSLAIQLFGEIVAASCLDPFGREAPALDRAGAATPRRGLARTEPR